MKKFSYVNTNSENSIHWLNPLDTGIETWKENLAPIGMKLGVLAELDKVVEESEEEEGGDAGSEGTKFFVEMLPRETPGEGGFTGSAEGGLGGVIAYNSQPVGKSSYTITEDNLMRRFHNTNAAGTYSMDFWSLGRADGWTLRRPNSTTNATFVTLSAQYGPTHPNSGSPCLQG